MRNPFENFKSNKVESTSSQDQKYHRLEKDSGWEDGNEILHHVREERKLYREDLKRPDLFNDIFLKNLKKRPSSIIKLLESSKDEMIKREIITKEQFNSMMQSFQKKVKNLKTQVDNHQYSMNENPQVIIINESQPWVLNAYSQVRESAIELLAKVETLAAAQQEEQKAGTYQPPEYR